MDVMTAAAAAAAAAKAAPYVDALQQSIFTVRPLISRILR
jgi:hypothetical protein